MKVILLQDVPKVGRKYEVATVADGYALNSLIPRHIALAATPEKIKQYDALRKKAISEQKIKDELIAKSLGDLTGREISIEGKASEEGHLFAGIHEKDIADAITSQAGIEIDASHINIDGAIKSIGTHEVSISVADQNTMIQILVTAKESDQKEVQNKK